ncbi:hypothetical protein, partial [Shinella sp. GWS1]|uniref:hypothetical protein n=1 Tax=Shinella sp. GWS1 TaxID=1692240 RepID=UPI001AEBD4FB
PVSDHRRGDVICFLDNAEISSEVNGFTQLTPQSCNLFSFCRAGGKNFTAAIAAENLQGPSRHSNPA